MSEKIFYRCETTGTEWEATIRWTGTRSKATHLDPEEWPTPEIDRAWRNGAAMSDPNLIPEDVTDEILRRAVDPEYGFGTDEPTNACDAGACGHERC